MTTTDQTHGHPRGYMVECPECAGGIFRSHWYDVAERYADVHDDTRGHHSEVVEVTPDESDD